MLVAGCSVTLEAGEATGSHAETAGICKLEGEGSVRGHEERGSRHQTGRLEHRSCGRGPLELLV